MRAFEYTVLRGDQFQMMYVQVFAEPVRSYWFLTMALIMATLHAHCPPTNFKGFIKTVE